MNIATVSAPSRRIPASSSSAHRAPVALCSRRRGRHTDTGAGCARSRARAARRGASRRRYRWRSSPPSWCLVRELARDHLRLAGPAAELPGPNGRTLNAVSFASAPPEVKKNRSMPGWVRLAGRWASSMARRLELPHSRREAERRHLLARRIRELMTAVPQHHVPEAGEAMDALSTVSVGGRRPITWGPDMGGAVRRGVVQRVNQVGLISSQGDRALIGGVIVARSSLSWREPDGQLHRGILRMYVAGRRADE